MPIILSPVGGPRLMDPSTVEKAVERGLPGGRAAYVMGRLVAEGRTAVTPQRGAEIYVGICREWCEDRLAGFDRVPSGSVSCASES